MRLIDPQPIWEEDPQQDSTGDWCGRFRCWAGNPQNPDVDVDVDVHKAPADMQGAEPKEIERKWYWVLPNARRHGGELASLPCTALLAARLPLRRCPSAFVASFVGDNGQGERIDKARDKARDKA